MRTHSFLRRLDHNRIIQAIKKAEGKSSGQIRVFIQRWKFEGDALPRAERKFFQLGMQKTTSRNAVLIFVAPREQKYAVVGDVGVHEKCGEQFWKKIVNDMGAHFKKEDFNRAIILAISEVGKVLAAHFPRTGDTINELPDEIVQG
ncbi:MAG TPA: TPM domain-containing protein [Chthoniobacterales bacterium]|nr:TPM domain-containing protein [Chthoniobacterales bacterium]